MVYMRVVSRSKSILHLARSPGLRSWATFVGIVSIGIGLLIYSTEGIMMKLFWFLCTVFVAISSLDDWEECIIDRDTLIIKLNRERLMERLLMPFQKARSVVADVSEVCSVMVEHEDIKFFGRGYYVTLQMNTGMLLPITEKCTLGDSREHQQIADVIDDFLKPELIRNKDLNNDLIGGYSSSSSDTDAVADTDAP
ncbi:cytochrome b-245 chaperone 1-like isoform X2 [Asterias rubens]|uniref:cytochrome b-245 chaperone 1-like isoform X2 n=1 Tax=Asterias rubens TaxID=7604 RepID=UPI001455C1DC|nr:cytochrome b-245 chaperone 1-like isoform X2 [Asterias rubens]